MLVKLAIISPATRVLSTMTRSGNRARSMRATQAKSLGICFFRDSRLVYPAESVPAIPSARPDRDCEPGPNLATLAVLPRRRETEEHRMHRVQTTPRGWRPGRWLRAALTGAVLAASAAAPALAAWPEKTVTVIVPYAA